MPDIDLTQFCAKEADSQYDFRAPFSKGPWTYATNRMIIIRVPRREDVAEIDTGATWLYDNPKLPDCEKIFSNADGRGPYTWLDVPDVTLECHFAKSIPVKFEINEVAIGLSSILLDLIRKNLPNPQIGLIEAAATTCKVLVPVKIRFDGGTGLLMPIRLSEARNG